MRSCPWYAHSIRRAVRLVLLIVLISSSLGCDSSGPVEDEAMITRLDFRLEREDPHEVIMASVQGDAGLAPGATVVADTVRLMPGVTYTGLVRLFDADGRNLTGQVTQDPENHQFFYLPRFGQASVMIQDVDPLGLPVGLFFRLSVPSNVISTGTSRMELGHFDPALGDVKTGDLQSRQHDLQYHLPVNIYQNGPPEPITRMVLVLQRADALETISVTAVGETLQLLGAEPAMLTVETCAGPEGRPVCASGPTLTLTGGMNYLGTVEVFNDATGEDVMEAIISQGEWHQFFYETDAEVPFTITDTDALNRPVGFLFEVVVPATPIAASLRIALDYYGRDGFKGAGRNRERDLDFSVPLSAP